MLDYFKDFPEEKSDKRDDEDEDEDSPTKSILNSEGMASPQP